MRTARVASWRMHVKPVRAHKRDTTPAMQMDGSQKYPTLQSMPTQKKSGKQYQSTALKEINCCCWDEREMSGVIMKLKKNLEFCGFLSERLFLWMLMSQASSFQSYANQGEGKDNNIGVH